MNIVRTRIGLGAGFRVVNLGGLKNRMAGSLRSGLAQNRVGLGIARLAKPTGISHLAGPRDIEDDKEIDEARRIHITDNARKLSSRLSIDGAKKVARKLSQMELGSHILAEMEPSKSALIFSQKDVFDHIIVLEEMAPSKAAAMLVKMEPLIVARILFPTWQNRILRINDENQMDPVNYELIAARILEEMTPDAANRILIKGNWDDRYPIFEAMKPSKAVHLVHFFRKDMILPKIDPVKAGAILEEMPVSTAASYMIVMKIIDAALILSNMHPASAAKILNAKLLSKDVQVLNRMDLKAKAAIFNHPNISDERVMYFLSRVKNSDDLFNELSIDRMIKVYTINPSKAIEKLNLMDLTAAGKILNDPTISDEKVIQILSRVDHQAELFNELNADRMVRIAQMGFVPKGR